jgi:hypothetical protein
MFDDLNEFELEEYARKKERERQTEKAYAICLEPAPKRRRVGLGTASHVRLSGSTELLSEPPMALPKTGSTKREMQIYVQIWQSLTAMIIGGAVNVGI